MFQNFKHQIACIEHHNTSESILTTSQKCIFNVYTKSPLQAVNSTFFLGRARTKNTAQNSPKHALL